MVNLFTLVLQISTILLVARVTGSLFRLIGQPRVVGEMAAGIILGPSVFGWLAPRLSAFIFPSASLPSLNALSQVGLVLFMFLVGLTLNPNELKGLGRAALLTSQVSIIVPFLLGGGLAFYLYPRLSSNTVAFLSFALFLAAAMSITAFPVLARILIERNLLSTRLGTIAISSAALNDVIGWCVLAAIMVIVRANHNETPLWVTLAGSAAFSVFTVYVLRPLLRRFECNFHRQSVLDDNNVAMLILLVLVSALITERLGIHLLFGAFLLGAVMPKDDRFVKHLSEKFESITVVLLLPLFFVFSGLRTSIGLVHGGRMWLYTGLIVLVAVAGKLGGALFAARAARMTWRESAGIGVLMNTRGLMELVILNIGLDIKVISPALFSMMVLMALTTTFMTTPLLALVCPPRWFAAQRLPEHRALAEDAAA